MLFCQWALYTFIAFGMMRPALREKDSGHGGIPERPKGADCKSAVTDFEGSNPSPTTISASRLSTGKQPVYLSGESLITLNSD